MKALFVVFLALVCSHALSARQPTELLKKMALDGDISAMDVLGYRYLYGEGEKIDLAESERWYRMAAVQMDFDGANGMGELYSGRKDYITAYAWFSLYADKDAGLKEAKDKIDSLIPKDRKAEAVKAAKLLAEVIAKEHSELAKARVAGVQK